MKIEEMRVVTSLLFNDAEYRLGKKMMRCVNEGYEVILGNGKKRTGADVKYNVKYENDKIVADFTIKVHPKACENYIGGYVGGIKASTFDEVITLVLQHEVAHCIDVLIRGFTRHDLKFKYLVNFLWGHRDVNLEKLCRTEVTDEQTFNH